MLWGLFIVFGSTVGPDVLRPLLISTKVIYLSRFVCSSFVLWAESLEKLYVIFYEIDGWCKFWEKKLFILWWSIATIYVLGILLTLWVTLSGRRDDVEVLKLASHTECMHTWLTDDFLFSAAKYHQHTHTHNIIIIRCMVCLGWWRFALSECFVTWGSEVPLLVVSAINTV